MHSYIVLALCCRVCCAAECVHAKFCASARVCACQVNITRQHNARTCVVEFSGIGIQTIEREGMSGSVCV